MLHEGGGFWLTLTLDSTSLFSFLSGAFQQISDTSSVADVPQVCLCAGEGGLDTGTQNEAPKGHAKLWAREQW